jgi:threonine dehydrogenase-like Zn-dependent dehydrogenase
MRALAIYGDEKMELREASLQRPGPREVVLKVGAVGFCGTDFHIYEGRANYNTDPSGIPIPTSIEPQILGHEFSGTVIEAGSEVTDLAAGDRVVVDQGLNCSSRAKEQWCEYCLTGNTHQCREYEEFGITGLQGALADFIVVPAVNAIRIESDLALDEAALAEPLGCIIHSCDVAEHAATRYKFTGASRVHSVLIVGAGPAGLLFTQYLRNVIGFDGLLIVSEPNQLRRELAAQFGASVVDPSSDNLVRAVAELTHGEKVHFLVDAAGAGAVFKQMPGLLRNQATLMFYGQGHHGTDLGVLNNIQFLEPSLLAPVGASGSLDSDGRPRTYRKALELLSEQRINVSRFITHRYRNLEDVPQVFAKDRFASDYVKGLAVLS